MENFLFTLFALFFRMLLGFFNCVCDEVGISPVESSSGAWQMDSEQRIELT